VSWNRLRESCPVCSLRYERHTGDTWFFMYMSTAGLTGFLVVCMFLLRPRIVWLRADCETPSFAAALVKLRSLATVANAARSLKFSWAIY